MFKKFLFILFFLMVPVFAWGTGRYSIKAMTPEVHNALSARKERFADLRALKISGSIGENNHGYVEALNNDVKTQSIVADENHDRHVIYETIAKQNGLEGALSTIESAFAQVQRDKADAGDRIQKEDGNWINK